MQVIRWVNFQQLTENPSKLQGWDDNLIHVLPPHCGNLCRLASIIGPATSGAFDFN
jgi:hypothetical protein